MEFISNNAAAVVGLAGALVGAILTYFTQWLLRRRDLDLRLWEKFLERRISAHENVVGLALKMRVMTPLGEFDSEGDIPRGPEVMVTREAFDDWLREFARVSAPATTWLSTASKRELNFVQDYLVTVHTNLSNVASECFLQVGALIRQDFIDLSSSLEKATFQFFESEARKLHLGDLAEHHKYALEETKRRLGDTVLLSKWKEIQKIVKGDH
jgi:hypothetical protein